MLVIDDEISCAQTNQEFVTEAPLSQHRGVTFPLAECELTVAAARQVCYHALRLRDAGLSHTAEAAMCKLLGPKIAVDITHQCLLTPGHCGWSHDLPHRQRLRNVMALESGDGSAQIMQLIVARKMPNRRER